MMTNSGKCRLRIALCGTRGIPACYGGFETFAEEISVLLIERGHRVTVYGRSHVIDYREPKYRGVDLVLLPAIKQKYLETPSHAFITFLHIVWITFLGRGFDIVLVCNAANSPFIWILRIFGIPVAVNVDGIERKRKKWNWLGRAWYRLGEFTSVIFASKVVADAEVIADYYEEKYGTHSAVLGYGFRTGSEQEVKARIEGRSVVKKRSPLFEELGIIENEYLLYVSRLEPENNAHIVLESYLAVPAKLRRYPLVMVGDAPYAAEYIAGLRRVADRLSGGGRIVFAGYRFGEEYTDLELGCYLYIQATEVGGTHPALVEAMGYGNCVVANDVPEHREVLGESGVYYEKNSALSLAERIAHLINSPDEVSRFRTLASARAEEKFSWKVVCDGYERLFFELLKKR